MEKRNIDIAAIVILLAWGTYGLYYLMSLNTSMQEVVLNRENVEKIYLQISRTPSELTPSTDLDLDVIVRDKERVQAVLDQLSNVKLKKVSNIDNKIKVPYIYTIIIRPKTDQDMLADYSIDILNSNSISIFGSGGRRKNLYQTYTITDGFDYNSFKTSMDILFAK
ncbi:hypothetical protein IAQ67_15300 [Paenibacillus peoriae]|uniref:Uncharacterized protein n=1 Tax=Paenibacillus peoriae TaxID=59893 RepID=A0A7H0Y2G6_9BACL|nr:hypothetical protein [Paenibacillus peoriae]QNR65274.1 hypothetical protein IAQ67_15300 [Paenibacillus peoriae]